MSRDLLSIIVKAAAILFSYMPQYIEAGPFIVAVSNVIMRYQRHLSLKKKKKKRIIVIPAYTACTTHSYCNS